MALPVRQHGNLEAARPKFEPARLGPSRQSPAPAAVPQDQTRLSVEARESPASGGNIPRFDLAFGAEEAIHGSQAVEREARRMDAAGDGRTADSRESPGAGQRASGPADSREGSRPGSETPEDLARGTDPETRRQLRQQDQQLADHVCGEGCGCVKSSAGSGEDPLRALERRDDEVRRHEQDHYDEAGEHARSKPILKTVTASNGRTFAVAGKVQVDMGEDPGDPRKTAEKMAKIRRAALRPASPSQKDLEVAAEAQGKEADAVRKLRERGEEPPALI